MKKPKISLCLIVKNEEKILEKSLKHNSIIADEIIIVDTGSKDKTIDIAKKFTNKIYYFKWINDFSAARNFSISKAKKDWILVLDADDFIQKPKKIFELDFEKNQVFKFKKYNINIDYNNLNNKTYIQEMIKKSYISYQEKLIKNNQNIRFYQKIHETIDTKKWTVSEVNNNPIIHLSNKDKLEQKMKLYFKLGKEELNQHNYNPNIIINHLFYLYSNNNIKEYNEFISKLIDLNFDFTDFRTKYNRYLKNILQILIKDNKIKEFYKTLKLFYKN